MSDPGNVERLRGIPLFAELDDEALGLVANLFSEVEAPAGQVIVEHGHVGSGMFLLEEGTVNVELPSGSLELGPGEFFGELAILSDDITRTARVRSVTPLRCLVIGRPDFLKLLQAEPQIAAAMLPVLARRLAAMDERGH
ncbi:MAG TPA: cyclic nucleotide-binding domain-containing protein [Actinomycetota bacterium]|jgi:CRP-like cAMP-binding protein|nr:cyclic nucleotide-binding domain-containing protein [Actinomycetota bacterium]